MTIIGGIAIYAAGVVTGGFAVAYNQYSIRRATRNLRTENDRLRERIADAKAQTAFAQGESVRRKLPNV